MSKRTCWVAQGPYIKERDDRAATVATVHSGNAEDAQLIAAAPDLAAALKRCIQLIDDLMPGVRHIALQDYAILNDAPLEACRALRKAGL